MSGLDQHDQHVAQEFIRGAPKPSTRLRLIGPHGDPVSLADFYGGRSAVLICGGPSLGELDLTRLDAPGVLTMRINNAWHVYRPDLWTGVDQAHRFVHTCWKDPRILKFVPINRRRDRLMYRDDSGALRWSSFCASQMPGVLYYVKHQAFDPKRWLSAPGVNWGHDQKTPDELGIKGKRSTMLAALHLLCYLGCRRITIIGADFGMSKEAGYAFPQGRTENAVAYNNALYTALDRRFAALDPHLRRAGIVVRNATPGGNLNAFERVEFDRAIDEAAAECATPASTDGHYDEMPKSRRKAAG